MRTYYKIIQINSKVDIQDKNTHSVYQHDLYIQLDCEEYSSKSYAKEALQQYLDDNLDDDGEYTILEIYSN